MNAPTTILIACVASFPFAACGTAARADAPTAAAATEPPHDGACAFVSSRPATLEVKRAPTGHLLVRPKLNGAAAGAWIFDTGAGMCVVSTPEIAALGLRRAGSIGAIGIGGAETAATFAAHTLELGPMTLRDHPLLAADLTFLEPQLGEKIVGVIGYGVLSRCVAELDFVTPRISLHDPATYDLAGAQWAELNLDGRTPAIRARFEGHEGMFQIDTGQNSAVVLQWSAVEKWRLHERGELRDTSVRGVGGNVAAKAGTFEWFEFAGVRQEHVDATFLMEAKGSRTSGTREGAIGATLLRPFVMITDYAHTRIAFKPR